MALLVEGARFACAEAPAHVGLPVEPSSRAAGFRAGGAAILSARDAATAGLRVAYGPGLARHHARPAAHHRLVRRTFARAPVADLSDKRAGPTRAATAVRPADPVEAVRRARRRWWRGVGSVVRFRLLETLLLGLAGLLLALGLQVVGRGLLCPSAKQTK